MKSDNSINPEHYNRLSPEPKDVIHSWDLNFNLGNAVKYIARAGHKGDEVEDLEKAQKYIEFELEALQKEREILEAKATVNPDLPKHTHCRCSSFGLCDSCAHDFPLCPAWGDDITFDDEKRDIIKCVKYENKSIQCKEDLDIFKKLFGESEMSMSLSVKPIIAEVSEGADVDEFIYHITGKKPEQVKTEDKQSEHITTVTECVCGGMKIVRFMGNTVEVPVSVPLPEALFFLLEHYVPVKRGK